MRRGVVLTVALAGMALGCTPEGDPIDLPLPGAGPTVVAEGIAFEPETLTIPAGVPTTITLENRDLDVPHAIAMAPPGGGEVVVSSEVVVGPATTTLDVPPLVPGRYLFICTVHPTMTIGVAAEG